MSDENITEHSPTPGEQLTAARQARGLSIEDVSNTLHILVSSLRAIEEDRYQDVLKGPTFARGYIKRYAEYLGLDSEALVQEYNQKYAPVQSKVAGKVINKPNRLAMTKRAFASNNNKRSFVQLLLSILVLVLLAAVIFWGLSQPWASQWFTSTDQPAQRPALLVLPEEQPVPSLVDPELEPTREAGKQEAEAASDELNATEAEQQSEVAEAVVETSSAPEVLKDKLNFELSADSWIEVRDSKGERLFADLVREGRDLTVEGDAPFSLIIGDGRGVEIRYNERPFKYSYARNGYAEITVP